MHLCKPIRSKQQAHRHQRNQHLVSAHRLGRALTHREMSGFSSKPTLLYLDLRPHGPLGGRGNATRLFLLANNIPFTNELMPYDKWMEGERVNYRQQGLSPLSHLPLLICDGKYRAEHVSISRYAARKCGLYGQDPEVDYESDAACDAYQEWRNAWAAALGSKEKSEEYLKNRDLHMGAMEHYYEHRIAKETPYLVKGDKPGFADTAIFNMIRDDRLVHGEKDLTPYPNLKAMYSAVDAVPEVRQWIEDWEKTTAELKQQ